MREQRELFRTYEETIPLADMRALVEESREPCPSCHCTNALNPHRMDRRKVEVLAALARFLREGDPWVRVEHGRGLQGTRSERWESTAYRASEHVARAYWFGLVIHKGPRIAEWKIAPAGLRFLRGDIDVPAKILCRGGAVVHRSIERVSITDIRDVELDAAYWNAYPWADFLEGQI